MKLHNSEMTLAVPSNRPKVMVYLPPEVKEDFDKLANYERRSLSSMCVFLIEEGIRRAKEEGKIT